MATSTVGSGQTYADLVAWESGEQGTYTDEDVIADCYGGTSLIGSSIFDVAGYTLNGTSRIIIQAASGERNPTSAFDSQYAFVDDTGGPSISFQGMIDFEHPVIWDGVQVRLLREGINTAAFAGAAAVGFSVQRTLIKYEAVGGPWSGIRGYDHQNSSGNVWFVNCIIDGFSESGGTALGVGQSVNSGATLRVINCTVINCDKAIQEAENDVIAINNRVGLSATNFTTGNAYVSSDYNRSDDATGTGGANDVTSAAMNFTNAGASDYSITSNDMAGSDLSGLTPPTGVNLHIDYVGNARVNYNPGAFEYIAPGGGGGDTVVKSMLHYYSGL